MKPIPDDDLPIVEEILQDATRLVRHLHLPAGQRHFYDDIVQDTMIVALRNLQVLNSFDQDRRRGWTFATMFLVARNTQRAEFRRTATWERLREAFHHPDVRSYFDEEGDDRATRLFEALNALSVLDRELVIGHTWSGYSAVELATQHDLTAKAVRHRLTRARAAARKSFEIGSGF